jgi:hypothetical protein
MRKRLMLVAIPAAGAGLLIAAVALAAHIPGATYEGTHQGAVKRNSRCRLMAPE